MKHLKCVFMDRKNMRQSLNAIREGIEILKQGYNLVLFPEGTRSKTGEVMEFKAGGFKLASKSNAAIVPVVINGSINMMKKGSIRIQPADVQITILPPLPITDENKRDTGALSQHVRATIIDELERSV
jgi:1-acyl-sn-glycerol-3-phosphate acyltransferase